MNKYSDDPQGVGRRTQTLPCSHPSESRYHLGIHCMSCSEDSAKSMQLVVTAITVVTSMTFCQLPMSPIRLRQAHNAHEKRASQLSAVLKCNHGSLFAAGIAEFSFKPR